MKLLHAWRAGLAAALGVGMIAGGNAAMAQAYPSKPIKWIVPFPPGGPTDSFSRPLALKLSEGLGVPVVIDNRGGAGGGIGMDALAKSAPDGYTIGLGTSGTHAINPALYSKLAYDGIKDFAPLTLAVAYTNILVINPNAPIKDVGELVAYARANPGKVTFGSAGNGSSNHLSGELLKSFTRTQMQHVPYKGSAAALTDVMADNLTFMFDILVTSIPQIKAGRVRALAVTAPKRSQYIPEVPTMTEAGVSGFDTVGGNLWFGIFAPAGTPRDIVTRLNQELVKALKQADVREKMAAQAFDIVGSTPEELMTVLRSDHAAWGKIVRESGSKID
jgi:tripartite-type tricarboxylate transporter receptor subunit TctC